MSTGSLSYDELSARMPEEVARGLASLPLGPSPDGFLHVVAPEVLDDTLAEWLGGEDQTRTPFARTALGDILYARDLRARAEALGLDAETVRTAYDVSLIDVRYKQISVLAVTIDAFLTDLADPAWLAAELSKDLYDAAVDRLGPPPFEEIYTFVPALALGGSADPANLQRAQADVALSILLQV